MSKKGTEFVIPSTGKLPKLIKETEDIKQGPWAKVYSGHMKRRFEYQIEVMDLLGKSLH